MVKTYCVGGMTFSITAPADLPMPANMAVFETTLSAGEKPEHRFMIQIPAREEISALLSGLRSRWAACPCIRRDTLLVYTREPLESRFLFFAGAAMPYAVTEEISEEETLAFILWDDLSLFGYDTIFSSLLSMERHLIQRNAMVLHCAYMLRNGEAILFSAPSGTGKSTQAELWTRYRGTRQINGDDAVLNERNGRWMANGFQVCGSSGICFNETYPIKAIVMLYQAKENTCRRLKPMEAFRLVYPQIKINRWSAEAQNRAMGLMESLIMKVPVLELGCDISEHAVACLEQQLFLL